MFSDKHMMRKHKGGHDDTRGELHSSQPAGFNSLRPFATFFFLKVIDIRHIHQPPTFPVMRRQQKRRETELCIGKLIGFAQIQLRLACITQRMGYLAPTDDGFTFTSGNVLSVINLLLVPGLFFMSLLNQSIDKGINSIRLRSLECCHSFAKRSLQKQLHLIVTLSTNGGKPGEESEHDRLSGSILFPLFFALR